MPPANREDVGLETALLLKEILDRLVLPPFEEIPGEIRVRQRAGSAEPLTWRFPDTEIEIVEIQEGENQGRFLFSVKSVRLIPTFYERVKEFPYREVWKDFEVDYLSPGTSPGFYDYYVRTPGYLIPGTSRLGGLVDALPDEMRRVYYDQTLWQWSALLSTLLITPAAVLLLSWLIRRWTRGLEELPRSWLSIVAPAVGAGLFLQAVDFLDRDLNITGLVLTTVQFGGRVIATALVVWAVFRLAVAVAEQIIASPRTPDVGFNANLIRIGARIVGFLVGIFVVVAVLRDLGADLLPLIAGLGVGGLAVALAAQRTFANFLGGFLLYLNKPVRVGDFCLFGDGKMGTVEEIGLLSTRIRTLERSLLTIPNADFSEYELDNLAMRDRRLFKTVLQLRYETSPRQLRYVIAKLRELLANHPRVLPEPRVRFTDLGEYSLDVEIFAYLSCQDQSVYLAIREDLLMQIVDVVEEAGTEFAFPSAVEYQAEATQMDAERGKEAEAQVDKWQAEGRLAPPNFEESQPEPRVKETGYLEESTPSPPEPQAAGAIRGGTGGDRSR